MNDYNNFSESYSNPRVKKLRSFAQSTYGMEAASYKGIAMKTLYFVAVFAAGMGAYFYIHNFFGGGAQAFSTEYTIFVGALIATAIAGLVASFAPKTTAVTGSIYSAGEKMMRMKIGAYRNTNTNAMKMRFPSRCFRFTASPPVPHRRRNDSSPAYTPPQWPSSQAR